MRRPLVLMEVNGEQEDKQQHPDGMRQLSATNPKMNVTSFQFVHVW